MMSFAALILAVLMVTILLPFFNQLAGKELRMGHFADFSTIAAALGLAFLLGILSGIYPAFFLSGFRPVNTLKGQRSATGPSGGKLRAVLVVFQFAASIILMVGTVTIYRQLQYIRNSEIGYDKEHVVVLEDAFLLGEQSETFKKEMAEYPAVVSSTISGYLPIPSDRANMAVFPEGKLDDANATSVECWEVDADYIKTLKMKLIQGRDFDPKLATDSTAVILNQAAVKQFGWDIPIGKRVGRVSEEVNGSLHYYRVIGVVEDFHFQSLRSRVGPLMLYLGNDNGCITFRIKANEISRFISTLRDKWSGFTSGQPFNYAFMDDSFDAVYRSEQRLGKIMAVFSCLAVLVGCLGLFGLANYVTEQKTKEIGIRKVLGATTGKVVFMLSRRFLKWILIANIAAWPAAYWMMRRWLNGFAYRTGMGMELFLFATAAALILAFITVGVRTLKTAASNPVDTLRYE
jgi:putative ABC transport system permease protein